MLTCFTICKQIVAGRHTCEILPSPFSPGEHTERKKAPTKRKIQRWNFMNKLVCAVRLFSNKSVER